MSKRFRNTDLSREAWYRKLKPIHKCAWNFICDECDQAGVWPIDEDAFAFYLGEELKIEEFLTAVNIGKERVEFLGTDKLFIIGFVDFQYGQLSKNCKPHIRIINLLKKHELFERVCKGYSKGIHTLEDKEEEKDKEEDKEVSIPKNKKTANIQPTVADKQLKKTYQALIASVKEMPEIKEQRMTVASFISDKRPDFIEPYMDLWNLSVKKYGLSQVENISTGRQNKFKTRIREDSFDFIKILTEINTSDYLQGKTKDWKADWDWIFENDTNYIKIIEGKYRN
jgi:hypothetical protein